MKKLGIIERTIPAPESFSSRSRIALLVAGLATVPACKMNLNVYAGTPAAERDAIVGEDGVRRIVIPELEATIMLGTIQKDERPRVDSLLYVSPYSPIRQKSNEIRQYELPKEAYPLTRLVIEPSSGTSRGRITLRTEGNLVALAFNCDGFNNEKSGPKDDPTCLGQEIDPKKLDKEMTAMTIQLKEKQAEEAKKKHDETLKKEVAKKAQAEKDRMKHESASTKAQEEVEKKPTVPDKIFDEKGKMTISATPEMAEKLKQLEPKLLTSDVNWLKKVARLLAKTTNYKAEVEGIIQDIEKDKQAGQLKTPNLVTAILFLLNQQPEFIDSLAKSMHITLKPTNLTKPSTDKARAELLQEAKSELKTLRHELKGVYDELLKIVKEHRGFNKAEKKHYRAKFKSFRDQLVAINGKLKAAGKSEKTIKQLEIAITKLEDLIKGPH